MRESLKSEMTEQVCACYLSQIIREYRERDYDDEVGSDQRHSEVMASTVRFAPFVVEDSRSWSSGR